MEEATTSIDCALYRLDNARLAESLCAAARRGLRVRVVLDRGKVLGGISHRDLLNQDSLLVRLTAGRSGSKSKMHHKFAVLDRKIALTGSYNWSRESEHENYDNLVVLREPALAEAYTSEFELLWKEAEF